MRSLAVLAFFLALPLWGGGIIEVTLLDHEKKPLSGYRISLEDYRSHRIYSAPDTDSQGWSKIERLPEGWYIVKIYGPDKEKFSSTVHWIKHAERTKILRIGDSMNAITITNEARLIARLDYGNSSGRTEVPTGWMDQFAR